MRKPLIITGIVVLLSVAAAFLSSQRGGLAHFSPHTLEYRTQSERTFFATGIPFYRSNHKQVDNPLVAMLIDDGFVSPQPDKTGRWELIFHWNNSWRDGYGPLYNIFHRHRDEIIKWSRNNRECAQIYWSEGFRLLRSNNTMDVAAGQAIIDSCWRINDPDEMRKSIQQIKTEVAM
jgi:hypothetical protein